ncbi:MAG TPA: ABC transporter permease [Bryobacteraceae bacterium]|nr:ABC transporter permease [Bryobacteraceae bacterium]
MLDSLVQDLHYALRALRSTPGFTAVAVLSLALGIGANTTIFSLIDAVMLRSLPVSRPEQLVQIPLANKPGGTVYSNPLWEELRDRQDVFSGVFALGLGTVNLASGVEAQPTQANLVSGDFFKTLGVRAALGRTFTAEDDRRGCPGVAVLSYDFWRRQFGGNPGVLNQPISVDGHRFDVIGVAQPGFSGVDIGRAINLMLPLCTEAILHGKNPMLDARGTTWLRVIGRPKPEVSREQVLARLQILAPQIFAATVPPRMSATNQAAYLKASFEIAPVATGYSSLRREYRMPLFILMGIVGAVLLIACANVANLLLARAAGRQREIAIRLALGAGRGRLIRQLLTESLVLAAAGAGLGLTLALWLGPVLVRLLSTTRDVVSLDLSPSPLVLAFTAAVAIATGLIFGLAPAWGGTRVSPNAAMKENSRGIVQGRSRISAGKVLVTGQVALSMVLLAGAALLLGSFRKLATLDAGFESERVLVVEVDLRRAAAPEKRAATYQEILDRVRQIPGVRQASASDNTPVSGDTWVGTIRVETPEGHSTDEGVFFNRVSPQFFATLGTRLLAGRDFDTRDRQGAPKVAIINETLARKAFGGSNPVGRRYQEVGSSSDPVEIVGVVADAKYQSLRDAAPPTVYRALAQETAPGATKRIELAAQGSPTELIARVKKSIEELNPSISLGFQTLSVQVAESLVRERVLATLSGFFGGLALLLATIGLYGVMAYSVARRRNEIGIRMALGAPSSGILRMVLREVTTLVVAGLTLGIAAAMASTRLLEGFLYGITARDPWTLSLAGAVLASVALLAGYLPARRASRVDPMVALREE